MGKKDSTNTVLIAAGAFAAWWLWSRASTISNLNFIPRGLAVVGGAISLILGVQNPTNNAIQLNALSGNLIINGNAIGNVADFQPVVIAPNNETPINLLVTANFFGLAAGALNAIEGNETGTINATLQGTANINGTALPVNVTFA
jgi:LEA14-like dessication related protein